jgi:ABC-type transport system substrate-binding protein
MSAIRSARRNSRAIAACLIVILLCIDLPQVVSPFNTGISPTGVAASGLPLFKMTIIVPAGDPVKLAISELLIENLGQLGIDCQRIVLDQASIDARVFEPNSTVRGKTYDEGGFDAILVGYQLPVSPDPSLIYNSTNFAPNGMNYYLWNDTTNDQLCTLIRNELNQTRRVELDGNWQSYVMDWLPSIAILYPYGSVVLNTKLDTSPFVSLRYPIWPSVERWSGNISSLGNTVVLAQPENFTNLIPVLSSSYYDSSVMNPVYGPAGFGLFQLVNMLSPINNYSYVPCMAKNWSVSNDLTNWNITIRDDIYFHDGIRLTAEDVNFTLHAYMVPVLDSPSYSLFKSVFGSNNSISMGPDNYTIQIRLPKPYAYIMDLLSLPILPKHVLEQIPYSDWKTSPFNTGRPSTPATYYSLPNGTNVELLGPIGAGPYRYVGFNQTTHAYSLTKFDNYFNRTALEAGGLFQISNYQVKAINSGGEALTEFADGIVHILDMQYHLELLGSYLPDYIGTGQFVTFSSLEVQELGFNMQHPVLGTGLGTPLGMINSSSAVDAAKHVRKAIAYSIPTTTIISQLFEGYGLPARTSVFCPLSEGYSSAIPLYSFNLTSAANELRAAGYEPAPLSGGFLETYGTVILLVAAAVVVIVTFLALKRTNLLSRTRKRNIATKKID